MVFSLTVNVLSYEVADFVRLVHVNHIFLSSAPMSLWLCSVPTCSLCMPKTNTKNHKSENKKFTVHV